MNALSYQIRLQDPLYEKETGRQGDGGMGGRGDPDKPNKRGHRSGFTIIDSERLRNAGDS